MKRNIYQVVLVAAVAVATFFLSQGCVEKKEGLSCKCCLDPVTTKTYVNADGKLDTILIYNAFTPNNEPYCDSTVDPVYDSTGKQIPVPGLCRPNKDSSFNDSINQAFVVKGIEKFHNKLSIRIIGDTSVVFSQPDYGFKESASFTGYRTDDKTIYGNDRYRPLESGVYEYDLILFKENKRDTLDRIIGHVCIIRTNRDCEVSNCIGEQMPDPLLK